MELTLISVAATLIVAMLGWLCNRIVRMERRHEETADRIEKNHKDEINRLYDHVGREYARRDTVAQLADSINQLVGRLDQLMQLMLKNQGGGRQ